MNICKLLSVCLMYPSQQWQDFFKDLQQEPSFEVLKPFVEYVCSNRLITLQEDYVATFDLNSKNSLYLFEHIHGDDKQRGMALVNLKEEYEQNNYTLDEKELADYIPAFLELLSQLEEKSKREYIEAAADVFVLLYNRLKHQNSVYQYVFYALIQNFGLKLESNLALEHKAQSTADVNNVYSCAC